MPVIQKRPRNSLGQCLAEYGLVTALLAVIAVVALQNLGMGIVNLFHGTGERLNAATGNTGSSLDIPALGVGLVIGSNDMLADPVQVAGGSALKEKCNGNNDCE